MVQSDSILPMRLLQSESASPKIKVDDRRVSPAVFWAALVPVGSGAITDSEDLT
jgi:hypothetical protein